MWQMKRRGSPLSKRQETVLRLREVEKLTCEEVGLRLGVSRDRVRQISATGRAIREDYARNGVCGWLMLPMRVRNVLWNLDLASRSKVKAAIKTGKFFWDEKRKQVLYKGISPRNMGRKSWLVLLEWASDDWEKRDAARETEREQRSEDRS